jgi:threonine dehydrogenase-like Zn-dependent dehydrogenase
MVRVGSEFGAPKHGTEMHLYRGHGQDRPWGRFPMGLGNMFVGRVTELGRGAAGVTAGQRVAGYGGLRPSHTVRPEHLRVMPERMTPQDAVCYDPAQFALAGVRDGQLRAGDTVAVFGLGAIGQMTVQICRLAGASWIAAVDPLPIRREAALRTGANVALDPGREDVPKALKDGSGGRGVDVVIETSASEEALDTALAGLAYGGTVAYVGWPIRFSEGPDLGEVAHFNVPNLVFARACSEPNRDHPRWDFRRLCDTCWQWLAEGRLDCATVVTPVVPFAEALQMYRDIDEHPEKSIKYGVVF